MCREGLCEDRLVPGNPSGDGEAEDGPHLGGQLDTLAPGPITIRRKAVECDRIELEYLHVLPVDVVNGRIEIEFVLEDVAFEPNLLVLRLVCAELTRSPT